MLLEMLFTLKKQKYLHSKNSSIKIFFLKQRLAQNKLKYVFF